jgi:pilus assembly protein Flp/PilA
MEKLLSFLKDEEGATAVEYGVLIALIIAILVTTIATLGTKIKAAFSNVVVALGS